MTFDPETDLSFTRTIDAPRDVVWRCWTTPEHIRNFFVPSPHRVVACDIDLRVGGRFNTIFEVNGNEMANEGVYLEIVQREKLVFTDAYREGWKPAPEPFLTAIVEFADEAAGGTRYTATARHRSADARRSHEEMGFLDGWGKVASQLETYARSL